MLLAVDIGNTNMTWGVFQGQELRATWRMATDVRRQADEYAALAMNLLSYHQVERDALTEGVIGSVVPPLTTRLADAFHSYFHIRPLVVGTGIKTGMRILYENPRDVGADRVAHAVAAYRLYGGPVIVVDFGTATVFDAITGEGDYLGGAIAPGMNIAAEALFEHASKLPRIDVARPKQAIGRNTVESMQAGLFFGYVGLIQGLVARFKDELGGSAKVVGTGGLARPIAEDTNVIDVMDPDLVLTGLRLLYEMNQKADR